MSDTNLDANAFLDPIDYKYNMALEIAYNQKIVDALGAEDERGLNKLYDKNFDPSIPESLINTHVFQFLRIPAVQTPATSYVLMAVEFTNVNRTNQAYHDVVVTLWAMAHQDVMGFSLPETRRPCTRIDYISQELRKMYEGQAKYGFNRLDLVRRREVIINDGLYHYVELVFNTNDLRKPVRADGKGWRP
jgi:hypothetical protein